MTDRTNERTNDRTTGITAVREEVAKFIEERDGAGSRVDPDNIFLTNGASEGVRLVMTTVLRKAPVFNDGVLVPIPQYPLYSATCTVSFLWAQQT
jgi:aspartate/methionine/tyrosine aminotransferase